MGKKLIALLLTGTLLVLSACSAPADEGTMEVDLEALAGELLNSGLFEETLNQVDNGIAEKTYHIADATAAALYVGSGAVVDELALFEFEDAAGAQNAVEFATDRVASQKESCEIYMPSEVKKLDNAVVETYGRYLVVCISDGTGTNERIEKYFEREG